MVDKWDERGPTINVGFMDHCSCFFIVERNHESVWDSVHGDGPTMGEPLPLFDVEAVEVATHLS